MTQVDQYVYLPKRLDESSRLAAFARLYSSSILSRVIGETRIVTSEHLPVTPNISCTRIIADGVSGHDPQIIKWFRLVYEKREAFSHFPKRLK